MKEEGIQDTPNHLIHIGKPIEIDEDTFFEELNNLKKEAYQETENIRELVKEIVPTYQYVSNKKVKRRTPAHNLKESVNLF